MKKSIILAFLIAVFLCLSACSYNPPEGWTERHHSYDEILTFAKSIDHNAIVAEDYTDTIDEYDWKYREWNATINGIDCHVSSVSDWVWNDGFAAGEFYKFYYRIDTDYDCIVMQNILSGNYSDWESEKSIFRNYADTIYVHLKLLDYHKLNDEELDQMLQTALDINDEYKALAINKAVVFAIPSPGEYYNHHGEQEFFVRNDSHTYLSDFSEEGKKTFIQKYKENWDLLDSGLPVYD